MAANQGTPRLAAFGKYRLTGHVLGEGSFAKVREAIDTEFGDRVALKVVDMRSLKSEHVKNCCIREANLLMKLDHPNVIKMFDCFKTTNHFVIVLDCMHMNLCEYIEDPRRGKLREPEIRHIFRQVASALSYLHGKSIVHRDVKLENILLNPHNRRAKLTDFGLSTEWKSEEGFLTTHCGSPEYSAPELHAGLDYTNAVDIWALGVVLFAMAVGRLPFGNNSSMRPVSSKRRREFFLDQIKQGIKTKKHQSHLAMASNLLKDLLACMLNTDYEQRIKIDEVLQHRWISFKAVITPRPVNISSKLFPSLGHRPETLAPEKVSNADDPYVIPEHRPVTDAARKFSVSTKNNNCI